MLTQKDSNRTMDRAIAALVSTLTGEPMDGGDVPRYTRNRLAAETLRHFMEKPGWTAEIRPVTIHQRPAFFYISRSPIGMPFAQGVGSTEALAICDAFRNRASQPT